MRNSAYMKEKIISASVKTLQIKLLAVSVAKLVFFKKRLACQV